MHLVGLDYLETHADPQFRRGTIGFDDHDRGYIYGRVNGTRALSKNQACSVTNAHILWPTDTNVQAASPVGVAQADMAINRWGWLQIVGTCTLLVKASCAAYTQLWTHATHGALDDATSSNADQIDSGLITTETRGGTDGPVAAVLYFPRVIV